MNIRIVACILLTTSFFLGVSAQNREKITNTLEKVVVTGSLRTVKISESPVLIELISSKFLQKTPSPSLFDAIGIINGIRPQLSCSVCSLGDIHINGMEGAYTMVLIDGMPIVSGLSTVYGMFGIPSSLIKRLEIIKGPAAVLYGSEAMAGVINVITKDVPSAPQFYVDVFTTSWAESNIDLSWKVNVDPKIKTLFGVNHYQYNLPIDNNQDGFTDITLQNRLSVFNKWNWRRQENRLFEIGLRYIYEDRWGGEMNWTPKERGSSNVYGESIYTNRFEFVTKYQLPTTENIMLWASYNAHIQDASYGNTTYIAEQHTGFLQAIWNKKLGRKHHILSGLALRYTYYDDNTAATTSLGSTETLLNTYLPGAFFTDDITFNNNHLLSLGLRYDYHQKHGNILSPRIAYKWSINSNNILRIAVGSGFRVVNIFTEDHAALSGARKVIVDEALQPERSYTANLSLVKYLFFSSSNTIQLNTSIWYTYFTNRIIPDYGSNPQEIHYKNLEGFGENFGISINIQTTVMSKLKLSIGGAITDVFISRIVDGVQQRQRQILSEPWSGKWTASYTLDKAKITIDYTGSVYGPMRLPLAGELDPRPEKSPIWATHNIQLTGTWWKGLECYAGVKNIFNWLPTNGIPFMIAGSADPFNKNVRYDSNENVIATPENPYALTFDPTYTYAPNQGTRVFIGIRYTFQRKGK